MGQVVFVTGGNRGIGRSIAEAFAAAGDTVVIGSRSGNGPDGMQAVQCDVTDTSSVDAAFDAIEAEHGRIDVVIANAGVTRDTLILRMSDDDIHEVLDTNLFGALRVARRAAKSMLRKRAGRIVFISSVVGMLGSAGQVNYAASKSGLVGAARSLARELGSRGITVNVVAPGFVTTDMTAELDEARQQEILAAVPLGRFAQPTEVAGVCRFLAGADAAYITGAVIPVDGGLGMGH